ncbi:MAG: AAA-like domain-containing protein [Capsulimonadaceae bacterium]
MMTPEPRSSTAPTGSFYTTGGTLATDAPSYVIRHADHDLLESLSRGEFRYVLNTRQMGKSSLMIRTADELRKQGCAVVVLDLTAVGRNLTPSQWYAGMLSSLAEQVRMEDPLEDFWLAHGELGPLQRFVTAIRQVVLPTVAGQLIIFVDEIDVVRVLPFPADELFVGIRECYNHRSLDPVYGKLTFCLIGVATPSDLIKDTRMSPFNVGRRVELADFTPTEAAPLTQGIPGGEPILRRVLYWTAGHPYMTQRLCREIADQPGAPTPDRVDALCDRLFLTKQARETDDNLAFVRNRLLRSELDLTALLELYRRVRSGARVKNDETNPLIPVLRLSGVVAVQDGVLRVRNRIYSRVFDKAWVLAHLPDAELRRQREAYRRGVLRTAAVAGIIVLAMAFLTFEAIREQHRARASESAARKAEIQAERETVVARNARESALLQKAVAETQRKRAQHQTTIAVAAENHATHEAELAKTAERRAVREAALAKSAEEHATREAVLAQDQRADAIRAKVLAQAATQSERAARQHATDLLRAADLQFAGQVWDSERGAARRVQALLAESRATGGSQSFDWRYQWRQLNQSSAASVTIAEPCPIMSASTGGGFLNALGLQSLTRMRISDRRVVSTANLRELYPHFYTAALAPDGDRIAIAYDDARVEVRHVASQGLISTWTPGRSPAMSVFFVGGGAEVVTHAVDDSTACWDARTGRRLAQWDGGRLANAGGTHVPHASLFGGDTEPVAFAWGDNRHYRATGRCPRENQVTLADLDRVNSDPYTASILDAGGIDDVAMADDGRTLATADNARVFLWDTATAKRIQSWGASWSTITSLGMSGDGSEVAVGTTDGEISLWDTGYEPPHCIATLKGSIGEVLTLAFSPDRRWLTSTDSTRTARVWDLGQAELSSLDAPQCGVDTLSFSPDGTALCETLANGTAVLWDTRTWRTQSMPSFLAPPGTSASLLQIAGSLFPRATDLPYIMYSVPANLRLIAGSAFSPDNQTVATSGIDLSPEPGAANSRDPAASPSRRYFIRLWNRRTGRAGPGWTSRAWYGTNQGPLDGGATALAFSPDGKTLAGGFGPLGDTIHPHAAAVWNVATGREIRELDGFQGAVSALAFSPDGRDLYAGCCDGNVYRFDTGNWRKTGSLHCGAAILSTALSPDGRLLAVGDIRGNIHLWDTQSPRAPRSLTGITSGVSDLAFTRDGRTLASAGFDPSVILWDVASGKPTRSLPVHQYGVERVAFSPDSTLLVSADDGGSVKLWRAASDAVIGAQERELPAVPPTPPAADGWVTPEGEQAAAKRLVRDVILEQVPGYSGSVRADNLLGPDLRGQDWNTWFFPSLTGAVNMDIGPGSILNVHVLHADGTEWHVDLTRSGIPLLSGHPYVLQFRARAARPITVYGGLQRDVSPWDQLVFRKEWQITPQWQAYRLHFQMGEVPENHTEMFFSIGAMVNEIQFANFVLVPDRSGDSPDVSAYISAER